MATNPGSADSEAVDRLTQQLVWFLKAFHEEQQKSGTSRETEFWRGNFAGMKRAMLAIYGEAVKDDVLDRLRQTTNLLIHNRRGVYSSCDEPRALGAIVLWPNNVFLL